MKAASLGLLISGLLAGSMAMAAPVINEFSVSTTGTDFEYLEVFGVANTDYSDYWVLEIEGDSGISSGTIDGAFRLGTTDANGFYLSNLPSNTMENGSITLLLVEAFAGILGTDLDTNGDGVLDTSPWAAIADCVGVHDGGAGDLNYCGVALGVAYDGLPFAPGGASRIFDGVDTDTSADWARNDFNLAGIPGFAGTPVVGEAFNTPGSANRLVGAQAVPEPGTAALLALALAGLGWSRQFRRL